MSGDTFDLDALAVEVERAPFTFRFDGVTYELPPVLDVRAAAALEAQRLDEALHRLLGPEQWAQLSASPKTFAGDHLWALLEAYARHLGVELGNSSASTASWPTTRQPSRPISSASTGSSLAS
jgi:hypothetical protein